MTDKTSASQVSQSHPLKVSAFLPLFLADLIVRTAYQIGKAPVLTALAIGLGASDALLGLIIVISTISGIIVKPWVGWIADRTNKETWLLVACGFFVFPCFLYPLLTTPEHLVALRLFHGLATAIFGPVTLSILASNHGDRRAELYGWFGIARQSGYILGPLCGGLLLTLCAPQYAFVIAGLFAALVFLPATTLVKQASTRPPAPQAISVPRLNLLPALSLVLRNRGVLAAAIFELSTYVSLYFYKAFLPVLALRAGVSVIDVGFLLAVQELVTAILRPAAGRFADRKGFEPMLYCGFFSAGIAVALVPSMIEQDLLFLMAAFLGVSQAVVQPTLQAMIASASPEFRTTTFGIVGAFRNAGKVLGPTIGGLLLMLIATETVFWLSSLPLIGLGTYFLLRQPHIRQTNHPSFKNPEMRTDPAMPTGS